MTSVHAPEVHIAGLVVHVAPARMPAAEHALRRLGGACVHAATPQGKLIVTLEALSDAGMTDSIGAIQHLPGVLSAALVYQCVDSLESMNEEIAPVNEAIAHVNEEVAHAQA